MRYRTLDEMVSYFNREVSEMDIDQSYKIQLLGMVSAIAYGSHKPQWIPCSDRLPEDNGAYLVTIQTKTKHHTYEFVYGLYIEVCIRDSRGWMTDENVTAWMPLPEPYKQRSRSMTEESIKLLKQLRTFHNGTYAKAIDEAIASAEPKKGKWGEHGECPFCGYLRKWENDNYCANCGARMEREE